MLAFQGERVSVKEAPSTAGERVSGPDLAHYDWGGRMSISDFSVR